MKKILIVLAMAMTLMSCTKEEIVAEEVIEICEFRIRSFEIDIAENGLTDYYALVKDLYGGEALVDISYDEYLKYSYDLNVRGGACWINN